MNYCKSQSRLAPHSSPRQCDSMAVRKVSFKSQPTLEAVGPERDACKCLMLPEPSVS